MLGKIKQTAIRLAASSPFQSQQEEEEDSSSTSGSNSISATSTNNAETNSTIVAEQVTNEMAIKTRDESSAEMEQLNQEGEKPATSGGSNAKQADKLVELKSHGEEKKDEKNINNNNNQEVTDDQVEEPEVEQANAQTKVDGEKELDKKKKKKKKKISENEQVKHEDDEIDEGDMRETNLDLDRKQHLDDEGAGSSKSSGSNSANQLLDIVELSRRRRLSKESADSLGTFIKWSFEQLESQLSSSPVAMDLLQSAIGAAAVAAAAASGTTEPSKASPRDSGMSISSAKVSPNAGLDLSRRQVSRNSSAGYEDGHQQDRTEVEDDVDEDLELDVEPRSPLSDRTEQEEPISLSSNGGRSQPEVASSLKMQLRAQLANLGNQQQVLNLIQRRKQHQQIQLASESSELATPLPVANKRLRQDRDHEVVEPRAKRAASTSPGSNLGSGSPKRSSHYLGNIVDRLHRQQLQHRGDLVSSSSAGGATGESRNGLSFQLQQFLEQQHQHLQSQGRVQATFYQSQQQQQQPQHHNHNHNNHQQQQQQQHEDQQQQLGSSTSQQLALAAAIHRALLGESNQLQQVDQLPAIGSQQQHLETNNNNNNVLARAPALKSTSPPAGPNLNLLVESIVQRTRRAYNTRSAGGVAASIQQRHAQAAAALSVLASQQAAALAASGVPVPAPLNHTNQQQQQQHDHHLNLNNNNNNNNNNNHHHQQQHHQHHNHLHQNHHQQAIGAPSNNQNNQSGAGNPFNQLVMSMAAGRLSPSLGPSQSSVTPGGPMVEFKCDTCPSSFDDRHRLMQHQSIHLELKKDWFTETPVDEVMKIFNRRRGEFLCNLCNLRFEATLDYDQHNHQVHGPRPYCCQFCGNGTRTFRCWRQYLNHLYDHRYVFSCTIDDCDFTVNRRDSLRFHIFRFHLNCQLPHNQNQRSVPHNPFGSSQQNNHHQDNNNNININIATSPSIADLHNHNNNGNNSNNNNNLHLHLNGSHQHLSHLGQHLNLNHLGSAVSANNNNSNNNNNNNNNHHHHHHHLASQIPLKWAAAAARSMAELDLAAGVDDDTENEMNVAD